MIRKPTIELQSLLITQMRQANTKSDHFKLNNLLKGFAGEQEFDRWISKYGQTNWIYLKDLRLSGGVPTQIDSMLLTPSGIYIYEIKNYDSKCTYFNRQFMVNGKISKHDIFVQAEASLERFRLVLNSINYNGPVHFHIIFINEHSQFSSEPGLKVKCMVRNELKEHLTTVDQQPIYNYDIEKLKINLLNYQVENPYEKAVVRPEQYNHMKMGIYCPACYSFQIEKNRYHFSCKNCNYKLAKKEALRQLITEVGVLKYQESITRSDILRLSGHSFSKNYIARVTSKIIPLNHKGRYASYTNPNELYNWQELVEHFKNET